MRGANARRKADVSPERSESRSDALAGAFADSGGETQARRGVSGANDDVSRRASPFKSAGGGGTTPGGSDARTRRADPVPESCHARSRLRPKPGGLFAGEAGCAGLAAEPNLKIGEAAKDASPDRLRMGARLPQARPHVGTATDTASNQSKGYCQATGATGNRVAEGLGYEPPEG